MEFTVDASLTGHRDLDLEVAPGTSLARVLQVAGLAPGTHVWCGSTALTSEHPAGRHPLVHGARLAATALDENAVPSGPHLAVIAGPDAGALIPLDVPRTWGRAQADVVIGDPALSRTHALLEPHESGVQIRDVGSTNGFQLFHEGRIVRGSLLTLGLTAQLGDTWIQVRGVPGTANAAPPTPVMETVLGPTIASRLSRHTADALAGLPDPTAVGDRDAEPAGTVAVTGPPGLREALARAVILARGRRPPAHEHRLDEPWLRWLPHALPGDGPVLVVDYAPPWCATEYRATPTGTIVTVPGARPHVAPPLGVSPSRADAAARRIAGSAEATRLPRETRWADIAGRADAGAEDQRSLAVSLGVREPIAAGAPVTAWALDLHTGGPHILVAGGPDSGTDTVLETFVLSACHAYSPQELEVVLVDFSEGAGLLEYADLPHVAGVASTRHASEAHRVPTALFNAMERRTEELAHPGCATLAEYESVAGPLARLMVVVNDFQSSRAVHRDFVHDLMQLAHRAASLGVHLVFATSRPAGAIVPEMRAHVSTTVALRVGSEAESRDLVGTGAAAHLDPAIRGRAVVAQGHERFEVQIAVPVATRTPAVQRIPPRPEEQLSHLADLVRDRWRGGGRAAPLWPGALPGAVNLNELLAPSPKQGSRE